MGTQVRGAQQLKGHACCFTTIQYSIFVLSADLELSAEIETWLTAAAAEDSREVRHTRAIIAP